MNTLAIDPSGNYNNGKGHTGFAFIAGDDYNNIRVHSIDAKNYEDQFHYWKAIIELISKVTEKETHIVIESYVVRSVGYTVGKMPETAMLIGAIIYMLEERGIKYTFQAPSLAKVRFKDMYLDKYIPEFEKRENGRYYLHGKVVNDHERDALKHLLYYKKYKEIKI